MALNANTFATVTLEPGPDQAVWTEGVGATAVTTGHYKNPTRPDEEILIDREKTVMNQFGTVMRRDVEYWQYDVPGAPPIRYEHKTYSSAFLPGLGRQLRLVEEEVQYFWAFAPWNDGDNLGRTRVVNAYVVYDLPEDPTAPSSSAGQAAATSKGMTPGVTRDRIVSSGKLWSSANLSNSTVEDAATGQTTKWVEGVIVEQDMVEEEFDKWTTWTLKKDALRSAGVEWDGPKYTRKESFSYRLPVPMQPPELEATNVDGGIRLHAIKGCTTISNGYFRSSGTYKVAPQKYNFYRKVVSEADRTPDPNLHGLWNTPPAAPTRPGIITDTAVTDYDGAPSSALPTASTYDEPHDVEPEPQPPEAEFVRIGESPNTQAKTECGDGTFLDTDVEDGAGYEYYATSVYGDQESTNSNHETQTFSGDGLRRHRLIDKEDVVDAIAANDPIYPGDDYGEVVEFDLPADDPYGDGSGPADDIANRQFAMNREEDFQIRMVITHPLISLEWGQKVGMPNVGWDTYGNAIHLATQTDSTNWMVIGFGRTIERSRADGEWQSPTTVLTLQERPRPQ